MRSTILLHAATPLLIVFAPLPASAQEPLTTRTATLERAQAAKAQALHPYEPNRAERVLERVEDLLLSGGLHWHPFFEGAYAGGGFTLGAGYARHVSAFNVVDVRGSFTFSGYKRLEAEFRAPRLFNRRGHLSVVGGWREATQVGFYGLGTAPTSKDSRANYSFEQPFARATLEVRPVRNILVLEGGLEVSQWKQGAGRGAAPSVEEVYTPATLPGLGAKPTYVHAQGGVRLDSRASPGYARRGGSYGVTLHDFADQDDQFGFRQVDYEAIQHIPILRDTWVLSLRGRIETTYSKDGQQAPFFMLPALGGGSTLRGFTSWRFRDRHSLLLQAEWRVLANRFLDMALFYDAGKVAARRGDLDLDGLKSDVGLGFRLHGPLSTPLRIEFAKGNEGLVLVFSAKAAF
jgi:hypothetical protein